MNVPANPYEGRVRVCVESYASPEQYADEAQGVRRSQHPGNSFFPPKNDDGTTAIHSIQAVLFKFSEKIGSRFK